MIWFSVYMVTSAIFTGIYIRQYNEECILACEAPMKTSTALGLLLLSCIFTPVIFALCIISFVWIFCTESVYPTVQKLCIQFLKTA